MGMILTPALAVTREENPEPGVRVFSRIWVETQAPEVFARAVNRMQQRVNARALASVKRSHWADDTDEGDE